jgi:hypothetical protein
VSQKNTWDWGGNTWKNIEHCACAHMVPGWLSIPLSNLDKLIIHITMDRVIRTYLPKLRRISPRLITVLIHQTNYMNKIKNAQALNK